MPRPNTALIGYTGFVGGTLHRNRRFDALYNSSNISDIAGASFSTLVCAGVRAEKWMANKYPEEDAAQLDMLMGFLDTVEAEHFVLVSTIDVYPDPSGPGDEDSYIDPLANHAYGRHRFKLECWAREQFEDVCIVRLPALFGDGLKKNAVFDLLNDNSVDKINPAGVYQWYPIDRFAADLNRIEDLKIPLVNLFTEPVSMNAIIERKFSSARIGPEIHPAPQYCLQSKHATLLGGQKGYLMTSEEVLGALDSYVDRFRASGAAVAAVT